MAMTRPLNMYALSRALGKHVDRTLDFALEPIPIYITTQPLPSQLLIMS